MNDEIARALDNEDVAALEALFAKRDLLSPADRSQLAEALTSVAGILFHDSARGKFDAGEAIAIGLDFATKAQVLCPGHCTYIGLEAFYLLERSMQGAGTLADCDGAIRLFESLLEGDPGDSLPLAELGRAEAWALWLRGSRSREAYSRALERFRRPLHLTKWFQAILRLHSAEGTDDLTRALWEEFFEFESKTGRSPESARDWIDFLEQRRKYDRERVPPALWSEFDSRLRRTLRELEPTPGFSASDLVSIGHAMKDLGRELSERPLLEKSLAFYERSLDQKRDPWTELYIAICCRELAAAEKSEVRRVTLIHRGLEALRPTIQRAATPSVERSEAFADLALDVRAPSNALLEEAADYCRSAIEAHGGYYFIPYRTLARVRLRQLRDGEALDAIEAGLRKLGHVMDPAKIDGDPAFQPLRRHSRFAGLLELAGKKAPWEV